MTTSAIAQSLSARPAIADPALLSASGLQLTQPYHEDRRFYSPEQTLLRQQGRGNPGILRLLELIRPVAEGTDMLQVLDVFRDHQHEHFFPVLDAHGHPVGLICERSLKSYVYSRFGMALLANRSQAKVLANFLTPCPSVEIDAATADVLDAAHQIAGAEGVLVTANGCYVGFVRASSLVELAHEQQLDIVHAHNLELDRKNTEIQAVLQNMRQGICTILPDLRLHADHSAHLLNILARETLAGASIMQVLFAHADLGPDALQQIEAALMAILDQEEWMYDCNAHLLPVELTAVFEGQRKILELHWSPLSNASGLVERLMLVVRDVTRMRQLQQQAEQHQRELRLLGDILGAGERRFLRFMQGSEAALDDCRRMLAHWHNEGVVDTHELLSALYRHLHTVKGNARTLGLAAVTDNLHAAEQLLQEARATGCVPDGQAVREALRQVDEDLQQYRTLYQQQLQGFGNDVHANASAPLSLLALMAQVLGTLPALAAEVGKPAPQVTLSGLSTELVIQAIHVARLESVMTHILRNSLDHGIEPAGERQALGKSAVATVSVSARADSTGVTLIVADDGRGLALNTLRDKARALAQTANAGADPAHMTDEEAAELMFHPGLSTAQQVSMISGRGVGMDAVRHLLAEAGASIAVHWQSTADEHCAYRPFALHIALPDSILEQRSA